jgi:glycosyltransferase involved in cell wall biosynthesis
MLPAPLVDGGHVLYTDGTQEDMTEKIRLIREDAALRKSLEDNARAYYEEHLRPEKVVSRILQKAGVPLPGSLD